MSRGLRSLALLAAAAGLLGASALAGSWALWIAAPLAVGLLAAALATLRGAGPGLPGWILVAAGSAWLFGVLLLASGATGAALLAGVAGAFGLYTGGQASLAAYVPAPGHRLPAPRSLRSTGAAAIDESMRWIWGLTTRLSPQRDLTGQVEALRAVATRNRAEGILRNPAAAHLAPPALEKVSLRRVRVPGAGRAEQLRFESEFVPRDPEQREAYLDFQPDRNARAYLWRHSDGPRPTLVCVHGYGMGRIALDARAWDVGHLHGGLGLDLALLILPLHGPRASGRRSGAGFLDGHPLWTTAALGQAIWELRRLAGWLRRQGAPAVGAYGMSLGGYTTAVWASLDPQLACAVPMIPAVSLPPLVLSTWSHTSRSRARAAGLTPELLSEAWASHDPLRHRPRVAPEARLLLAGLVDRICPPLQAHALWEHWDRPPIHWFPGSHLAPFGRRGMQDRLDAHLRETLLGERGVSLPLTRFRR